MYSKKVKQMSAWKKESKNCVFKLIVILSIAFMLGTSLLFVFAPNASAGGKDTMIYGWVTDSESGDAINNAKITIRGEGNESYTVYTNESGYYEKVLEHGGNYTVIAEKDGYKSEDRTVYIKEGEYNREDFELEKEGSEKTTVQGYTKEKDSGDELGHVNVKISKDNFSKETTSTDKGYYEFELEEGGEYLIKAEKDGYKNYEDEIYVREGEENEHHINMEKKSSGNETKIYGQVIDKDSSEPIYNAEIFIQKSWPGKNYTTYTDRNGSYDQTVEEEGNYSVYANKDGYKGQEKYSYVEKNEHKSIDFELEKDGGGETYLKGYIKDKDSGALLKNVHINIMKGNYSEDVVSDNIGRYSIHLEEGGWYDIRAEQNGYKDYIDKIYIEEGKENEHNIYMEKEISGNETKIYGYVKDKDIGEAINDAEITIQLKGENKTYKTYSDRNGSYSQKLNDVGNYTVIAEKDGYKAQEKHIYIEKGEEKRVDFELEKEGGLLTRIFGYVKDKFTNDSINEVYINVVGKDFNCSYYDYTDNGGYYNIDIEAGRGNYTIRTLKDGYKDLYNDFYIEDEKEINMHLEKESEEKTIIEGYVTDAETGIAINDVSIFICTHPNGDDGVDSYSNEKGYFYFERGYGGNCTFVARKDGYLAYGVIIFLKGGERNRFDFEMETEEEEKTKIYGYVKEKETHNPISDANVYLVLGENSYNLTTNDNGYYEIELEDSGKFIQGAFKKGYKDFRKEYSVQKGEHKSINITLEKVVKEYVVSLESPLNIKNLDYGETVTFEIYVINNGDFRDLITLSLSEIPKGWNTELEKDSVELDPGKSAIVKLTVIAPNNENFTKIAEIRVTGTSYGDESKRDSLTTLTTIKTDVQEKLVWIVKINTNKELYKEGNEINCTVTIQRAKDFLTYVYEGKLSISIIDENNKIVFEDSSEIRIPNGGGSDIIHFNFILKVNGTYTIKAKLNDVEGEKEFTFVVEGIENEEGIIPGFDTVAVATAISIGALVAFFRRRD